MVPCSGGKQELQLCVFKNKIIFESKKHLANEGMNKIIHYEKLRHVLLG
jgi:hypothetical protein